MPDMSGPLARLGAATEVHLAPARGDGTFAAPVPIWVVSVDGAVYVRAYRGDAAAWYRRLARTGRARVDGAGVQLDVVASMTDDGMADQISAAYRSKYAGYGARYVNPMLAPTAVAATVRLDLP